jgi:colanic acid/amylovoran biosynthesis glycosyltransferase
MKIAYLVGHYPSISHTFILREVEGLRARGVELDTISVHRAAESQLLTGAAEREHASTYTILPPRWGELARAHLSAFARAPLAYLGTLALAVRLSRPGLRGHLWQLFYFAEAMAVWKRCRARGIRHLHAQFTNQVTDIALLVTRYESGSKSPWTWSFTVHGPDEFYEVSRFNLRAKVESADFVVCISDFARSQLMAQVPEEHWGKLYVIHCGIDAEVFSPPAERNGAGRLDVLSVGRLVPFKGQGLLIEALAGLAARGIDARAIVVGWGETQPGLESLAAKLGIADRVTFTGALGQDEIRRHLDAADVFCLPSFAEGVPVSLMEAMAMELPVVSSRIMGIPELVEDGISGRLVAPGNVAQLTAVLESLAGDPAERRRLGREGRQRVIEHYAIDRSTAQLHALFNERLAA